MRVFLRRGEEEGKKKGEGENAMFPSLFFSSGIIAAIQLRSEQRAKRHSSFNGRTRFPFFFSFLIHLKSSGIQKCSAVQLKEEYFRVEERKRNSSTRKTRIVDVSENLRDK